MSVSARLQPLTARHCWKAATWAAAVGERSAAHDVPHDASIGEQLLAHAKNSPHVPVGWTSGPDVSAVASGGSAVSAGSTASFNPVSSGTASSAVSGAVVSGAVVSTPRSSAAVSVPFAAST